MTIESNHTLKPELNGDEHQCNKCGKQWDYDDALENQEKLYKHDVGGYSSVFGDQQEWSVTLCQDCTLHVLGPYIKYGQYFE